MIDRKRSCAAFQTRRISAENVRHFEAAASVLFKMEICLFFFFLNTRTSITAVQSSKNIHHLVIPKNRFPLSHFGSPSSWNTVLTSVVMDVWLRADGGVVFIQDRPRFSRV